jgi:hypothetical protein
MKNLCVSSTVSLKVLYYCPCGWHFMLNLCTCTPTVIKKGCPRIRRVGWITVREFQSVLLHGCVLVGGRRQVRCRKWGSWKWLVGRWVLNHQNEGQSVSVTSSNSVTPNNYCSVVCSGHGLTHLFWAWLGFFALSCSCWDWDGLSFSLLFCPRW